MIDFSACFARWVKGQIQPGRKLSPQEYDELAATLYEQWLRTPQEEMSGRAPAAYFDAFDGDALVDALLAYARDGFFIPGPLCDALGNNPACAQKLLNTLDEPLTPAQNMAVLERLSELQEARMVEPCLRMITGEDDQKADQAAQALLAFGNPAAERAMALLQTASFSDSVTDRLADIVASMGAFEGAYEALSRLFLRQRDARAFYAQCLAKMGDERALALMKDAAQEPDLSYFDFMAIRDAVEALGGTLAESRDFSSDKDYITLEESDA